MREFKVVIMGSGGVGKSAITIQFVSGTFMEKYDPTIEDFYRKQVAVDGMPVLLEILDTAGTEQFSSMRDLYIRNGQGFILVYSVINNQTLRDVFALRDQIHRVKGTRNVPMILAGNKVDLADHMREVPFPVALQFSQDYNLPLFETSAKTKQNIDSVFEEIVRQMIASQSRSRGKSKKSCNLL